MSSASMALALALGSSLAGLVDAPEAPNPIPAIAKLVGDLGAPDYQLREQATAELEKHGVAALPALRQAAKSNDPEISDRASELLRKIAAANPQAAFAPQVALDYPEASLEDVIKGIASQSGVKIELTGNSGKIVTLREPQPLPFWQAIDRVCVAGGLKAPTNVISSQMLRQGANRFRTEVVDDGRLLLNPGRPVAYPSYYSGYYCVRLLKLQGGVDREMTLSFGNDAAEVNLASNEAPRILEFALLGKPGAKISPNGPLSKVEVIDDRGRDVADGADLDFEFDFRNRGRFGGGRLARFGGANLVLNNEESGKIGVLTYRISLDWPDDPPPQSFKRIQATIPISIDAPSEPIAFRIADAVGKPIDTPAAVIEIQSIATDAKTKLTTIVAKFSPKRPNSLPNRLGQNADPFGPPSNVDPDRDQFTFEDGDGRTLTPSASSGRMRDGSANYEWRFQGDADSPNVPIKMTVQIVSHQDAAIAFEFSDVPVPKARK